MYSARRRIGTYFQSDAESLAAKVRAPQTTIPVPGNARSRLTPAVLSRSATASLKPSGERTAAPFTVASTPAGAFHTPRDASVRLMMPATAPHGAKGVRLLASSGFLARSRGKYTAALWLALKRIHDDFFS